MEKTPSCLSRHTDEDLVSLLKRGDGDALKELMQRYKGGLFSMIMRYHTARGEAEDIFQETWLRVFTNRKKIRSGTKFSTWLFQIAINLCRDHWRRAKVRQSHLESAQAPAESPSPGHALDLKKAVRTLPREQRETLLLRYYQGFSEIETAAILKCPQGTVKSRLHKAVRKLRESLCQEKTLLANR